MKVLLFMIVVGLMSGCASSGLSRVEKAALYDDYIKNTQLEQVDKITTFRLYSWTPLDNKRFILKTSPRRAYLIALQHDCWDLDFAQGIKVNQSSDLTLQAKFDSISVVGSESLKCYIESIHKLTPDQAEELAQLDDKAKHALQ